MKQWRSYRRKLKTDSTPRLLVVNYFNPMTNNKERREGGQKWLVLDGDDGWQIIVPETDIKPHGYVKEGETEVDLADFDCPCKPRIDGHKIIIHNSFEDMEKINVHLQELISDK
jgi:hypothetical protein